MHGEVSSPFRDAWHTLAPRSGDPHGPLPPLLVALTLVTGLVDAFSYLELGHVFVANMTGNVVFLAFAAGGVPGFLWWASILGIVVFLAGAYLGGRLAARHSDHRGKQLRTAVALQAALVVCALLSSLVLPHPYGTPAIAVLVVLLGMAMGLQNATARSLAVPDLTTTVLTLTLVGISADSRVAGGSGSRLGRRIVSILAMFLGALIGALLVTAGAGRVALLLAACVLVVTWAVAIPAARTSAAWVRRE